MFEYVQGEPLASLINGRALNVRRALEFAINLADALAEAHAVEMMSWRYPARHDRDYAEGSGEVHELRAVGASRPAGRRG